MDFPPISSFDLAREPAIFVDREGVIRLVNEAWTRRLSWSTADIRGLAHADLLHTEDRCVIREWGASDGKAGSSRWSFRARYRHRLGGWCPFQLHAHSIEETGDTLLVAREVEGRAEASPQSGLTELEFSQVLDAMSDCILVKGPQSRIVWANRAFRELYGMSNEQLRDMIDAPFSDPHNTERYLRDDQYVFEAGKALEIPEDRARRYDGEEVYFHTVKSPIYNERGQVAFLVGVLRDITERKRTDKLLEEQRSRMIAAAKMSALGEMAGGIAHEINNPLAAIQLRAEQLRELASSPSLDPVKVLHLAEKIGATCQRIAKIAHGLRAFVRDVGRDPFQRHSLRSILDETIALSVDRMQRETVELRIDVPVTDVGEVECRPVELSQVLLNLLNNAADAVAGQKERWVRVGLNFHPDSVELRIADSGPGIPPEVRGRIFDPFFTTKAAGKGTGLGLSVSKGIVESHQGTLRLDTDAGHTCFVVALPRQRTISPTAH